MTLSRITTALALIGAAFIGYIGIGYLIAPQSMAASFGLPAWPHGTASAFMNLKGVRDVTSGAVILALLLARQRFALGVAMLAFALTPIGDMLTVLTHHGSVVTALSVRGHRRTGHPHRRTARPGKPHEPHRNRPGASRSRLKQAIPRREPRALHTESARVEDVPNRIDARSTIRSRTESALTPRSLIESCCGSCPITSETGPITHHQPGQTDSLYEMKRETHCGSWPITNLANPTHIHPRRTGSGLQGYARNTLWQLTNHQLTNPTHIHFEANQLTLHGDTRNTLRQLTDHKTGKPGRHHRGGPSHTSQVTRETCCGS